MVPSQPQYDGVGEKGQDNRRYPAWFSELVTFLHTPLVGLERDHHGLGEVGFARL